MEEGTTHPSRFKRLLTEERDSESRLPHEPRTREGKVTLKKGSMGSEAS